MQRFFLQKQYFFLLLLFSNFSAMAQVKKDTIYINYASGNINIKSKKLKVGSFVFIKIDSLPKDYKVNAVANFENGNLENGSMFSSMLNRDLDKYNDDNTKTQTTKDTESQEDKAQKEINKSDTSGNNNNNNNKSNQDTARGESRMLFFKKGKPIEGDKNYKTDIFNLAKTLDIGIAKNYLTKLNKIKSSKDLDSAIGDLEWQKQTAIKNAQENIFDLKRRKDIVILNYAYEIDSLLSINNKITDSLTPKYISKNLLGIQIPNTDFTEINIIIKDTKNNLVNEIPLTYNNVGGFKLDFSVGFFNALYETFNYKIVQKDTLNSSGNSVPVDSIYRVAQNSNGTSNISFGILAHGYWRTGEYFSPGISSGFTYTPATKNLNFLIGASALLGRKQRLIVTSGIAFSKVKELAFYQTNKFYKQTILNPNTIGDLPTIEKTKPSWFFGLSYNLGIVNNGKESTKVF